MVSTYSVIFNSGQGTQFKYETGDNVDFFTITNSDQSYYQNASLRIHDLSTSNENNLDLNSTLRIYVDDSLEFDGYINRIQKSILGKRVYDLQGIGRTYDLWRFKTSSITKFTNKYTSYIVSSLVKTYCSSNGVEVYPHKMGGTSGSYISYVTFPDMEIGSCIGRMSQMDGYNFFVDSDKTLNYYEPTKNPQFTIEESDVIEMSPHERSDDSMKNSVLVLGYEEYEKYSEWTISPDGYFYISGTKEGGTDGKYIAQKIKIPTDIHLDRLSSIKIYADRSTGDNTPYYLQGHLRTDSISTPGTPTYDDIASSNSLKFLGTDIMSPPDWTPYYTYTSPESFPITGGQTVWVVFNYDGASPDKYWKLAYSDIPDYEYFGNYDMGMSGSVAGPTGGALKKREYYDTGDDGYVETAISYQHQCQTFTIGTVSDKESIELSGIAVKGYVKFCEGDEVLSFIIKNVDDDGKPTGDYLAKVTKSVGQGDQSEDVPSGTADWFYYGFPTGTTLYINTMYALEISGNMDPALSEQFYWSVDKTSPTYNGGTCRQYVASPLNDWGDTGYDAMFKISGITEDYTYGEVNYDSAHNHIYFAVSSIGYAGNNDFDDDKSRVYKNFAITGGGTTSDLVNFFISAEINTYWSGESYGKHITDDYSKYEPRLMIGVYDPTSPGGNNYNPMLGLEFNLNPLKPYNRRLLEAANTLYFTSSQLQHCKDNTPSGVFTSIYKPTRYIDFVVEDVTWKNFWFQDGFYGGTLSKIKASSIYYVYINSPCSYTITGATEGYGVRPFFSNDITKKSTNNPQYFGGDWIPIGTKTYECKLSDNLLTFYVDGSIKNYIYLDYLTLDGNYKFGKGNYYDWSGYRIQLIDSASGSKGEIFKLGGISGNISYIKLEGVDEHLSISTDSGNNWSNEVDKSLLYSIGWNYDNVRGEASDNVSINKYGEHFYKVSEPLLTTYTDCENYADRLVDIYKSGIATGEITINGRTDVDIKTKFKFNGTNLDIEDNFVISQYEQIFDKDGFRTKIIYGEAPYDIARKVANLESEVYE